MHEMVGDGAAAAADEGRLVVVEDALEHRDELVVRDAQVEEDIDDPRRRRPRPALVREGVRLKQRQHRRHIERRVRQVEACTELADRLRDGFPRALVVEFGGFVCLLKEVLPCGADVGEVAMVGDLVDEEAEIVVAGLVSVSAIELFDNVSRCIQEQRKAKGCNLHRPEVGSGR